jgi:hypothetical protein
MPLHLISQAFLVLAISLSWNRFASIFSTQTSAALAASPLTIAAAAISLSALGLAFSGNTVWLGTLIVVLGFLIGSTLKKQSPAVAVALSAISLTAYLQFSPFP